MTEPTQIGLSSEHSPPPPQAHLQDREQNKPKHEYPGLPLTSQHQIRVLSLAPGSQTADLEGNLEVVSLDKNPQYEALSYTWGKTTLGATIQLGQNCSMPVTDNLSRALRRLRRIDVARELWIDAICIKQSDSTERGAQVAMMGDIYGRAWQVCIWLGDLQYLSRDQQRVAALSTAWDLSSLTRPESDDPFEPLIKPDTVTLDGSQSHVVWHCFEALTSAIAVTTPAWHTRAWVLQELLNAKSAMWCFGPFELSGSPAELSELVRAGRQHSWRVRRENDLLEHCGTSSFEQDIGLPYKWDTKLWFMALLAQRFKSGTLQLKKVVSAIRFSKAIVPHDMVYSLLGIIDSAEAQLIVPDYTKPFGQVFAEATFATIVEDPDLGLLNTLGLPPRPNFQLPSWTFDFSNVSKEIHGSRTPETWKAHDQAALPFAAPVLMDWRTMILTGALLDEVTTVHESLHGWCVAGDPVNEVQATSNLSLIGEDEEAVKHGKRHTFVIDVPGLGFLRFSALEHWTRPDYDDCWSKELPDGSRIDEYPLPGGHGVYSIRRPGRRRIDQATAREHIFQTWKGYIGVCINKPVAGDVVALIRGLVSPIVLGKREGCFYNKDFAYVWGLMNGEVNDLMRTQQLKIANIDLV